MHKLTMALFVLTSSIGLFGCASNSEVAQLRAMAEKAEAKANNAHQIALEARQMAAAAQAAEQRADSALKSAAQANQKADQALEKAHSVDRKIDRMFKKTMMK